MPKPRDMLHVGQASTINTKTGSCRVAYDDLGGHVSYDMQLIYPAMGKWKAFWIPQIGDHLTTMRLPNGNPEGFVVGTQYTANNMPTDGAEGVVQLISEDGESVVRLNADGTITLKIKRFKIEAENIEFKGEMKLDGNLNVKGDINNEGNMNTQGIHTDSVGRHVS